MIVMARICSALFCISLLVACTRAGALQHPWADLVHSTAWTLLGDVSEAGAWKTQLRHVNITQGAQFPGLPVRGDVLEVTEAVELVILGYGANGERDRLLFPGVRALSKSDLVGSRLQRGSRVMVHEVRVEKSVSGLAGVWVRVGPEKS